MALGMNNRMMAVEDNGPRRKRPAEENISIESIVETTPYQQRMNEIRNGVNTAKPVNYSLQASPAEEETRSTARHYEPTGGMSLPPSYQKFYEPQEEPEVEIFQNPAPKASGQAVSDGLMRADAERQSNIIAAQRRADEEAANRLADEAQRRRNAQLTQEAIDSSKPTAVVMTPEEEKAWYEENGLAWAYPPSGNASAEDTAWDNIVDTQPVIGGGLVTPVVNVQDYANARRNGYEPSRDIARYAAQVWADSQTPTTTPTTVPTTTPAASTTAPTTQQTPVSQNPLEDYLRANWGRWNAADQALAETGQFGTPPVRDTQTSNIPSGAADRIRAQREADLQAAQQDAAMRPGTIDMFNATLANNPDYQDAFDTIVETVLGNGTAQDADEARTYAINAIAPELGYDPWSIIVGSGRNEGTGIPDSYYQPPEGISEQDRFEIVNTAYQDAYDKAIAGGDTPQEAEAKAIDAAQKKNSEVTSPKRAGEDRAEKNSPSGSKTTPTTSGVDDVLADVMGETPNTTAGNTPSSTTGSTKPEMDVNAYAASKRAGYEYNGDTSSGENKKAPKGTTYFTPSYDQGGKGVKLPYKTGGYTEKDLEGYGNKAYGSDNYGNPAYEGYYRAPDGHYYPVDQEKAAYYMRYGTYKGWEEPMREYYNNFGTFSGYSPTWKSTGRTSYGYGGYGGRSSYYGSNGWYQNAETANQEEQKINNIAKNWAF